MDAEKPGATYTEAITAVISHFLYFIHSGLWMDDLWGENFWNDGVVK